MHIADLIGKAKQFTGNNQSSLLAGGSIAGVVSTGVLAWRGGYRAGTVVHKQALRLEADERTVGYDFAGLPDLTRKEKIKLLWPQYAPPVAAGSATIASIIFAHKQSGKQIAALALASSLSEQALKEYKAKVVEKLGEAKDVAVRDSIAQDQVDKHPVNTREIILAGTGEVLCFDIYSGRYFQSSIEEVKKAENTLNFNIINHGYASLSEFYDLVGLPPTGVSDEVGWDLDNQLTIAISTTMSTDNRPCIAIDFAGHPQPNYNRFN